MSHYWNTKETASRHGISGWSERQNRCLQRRKNVSGCIWTNKARKGRGDEEWGSSRIRFCIKIWRKCLKTRRFRRLSGRQRVRRGMDGQIFFVFCAENGEVFAETISTPWEPYAAMEENGRRSLKDTLYLSDDMIQHNLECGWRSAVRKAIIRW